VLPTGAIVQTFDRKLAVSAAALTSGTAVAAAVELASGVVVSSATILNGGTALATGTHQWAALCDATGKVLAVSADGTSGAWGALVTKTFTFGSAYTTTAAGVYYLVVCVVATTMPTPVGITPGTPGGLAPAVWGAVAGQTTPPAVNSTLTLSSAVSTSIPYGYLS
jgi:hypothetical protein